MSTRRNFLQQSSALALGGLVLPRWSQGESIFKATTNPIGIQLYTLTSLMSEDPKNTLQKVAAIGYKELETAATSKGYYYGFKPKELAAMVKDMGMHLAVSSCYGCSF